MIMEERVGVQVGYTHMFVNEIPPFLMVLIFGVFGLMLPSEKPLMASFPRSSAIISRMFGDSVEGISIESFLQAENRIAQQTESTDNLNFMFFFS